MRSWAMGKNYVIPSVWGMNQNWKIRIFLRLKAFWGEKSF